ncbi:MAG: carboxy terminal-processing peptidase [Bacteroidota bacterium]
MSRFHYQPQNIDDDFSEKVFTHYIETLYPSKRFLTAEDVAKLDQFKLKIDDELEAETFQLFDLSVKLFDKRREEAKAYYQEILDKPFDFSVKEEVEGDPEKMAFASNSDELKERWRKALKLQTLSRLVTSIDKQEKSKKEESGEETVEIKPVELLEEKARAKVLKSHNEWFKRMEQERLKDKRADYINAITTTYDPHTEYLPPKDKQDFDIRISGRLEGIGAQLNEEDGFIKVVRIVHGSPSFLQGDLEVNDKIIKVGQGEEEAVDVVDMNLDDAIQLIRGKKGTEVRLTVQKIDGSVITIPLVRDVIIIDETYAKSAILKADNSKKGVGYIHLPKFYFDLNDRYGRRAATDVSAEIEKLKLEKVDGIILDLRNNGGGSLADVVEMAGLFIEEGPIVQVKSREGKPYILRDRDPEVQYEGKLVVLVNEFSASASEIMAAAIQDYKRGVVVGTTTYGKGTVQRFVDLDDLIRGSYEVKPLGDLKMTTQKFYRINGGATQLKGVVPDIILPNEYSLLDIGERENEYSMAWDEIEAVPFKEEKNAFGNLSQIKSKSEERLAENQTFKLINQNAERLKRRQESEAYPLQLDAYRAQRKAINEEAEKYKDLAKEIEGFDVSLLEADLERVSEDEGKTARLKKWRKDLTKDAYVYEALQIIKSMK